MDKKIEKMLEYFTKMDFVDILGFGHILGAEETEEFEDYVVNILEAFNKQPRVKKKQLLKLAKDVVAANRDRGTKSCENELGTQTDTSVENLEEKV